MKPTMKELEELIDQKIAEGIFSSREEAVECIKHWIDKIEEKLIYEKMRNEDA